MFSDTSNTEVVVAGTSPGRTRVESAIAASPRIQLLAAVDAAADLDAAPPAEAYVINDPEVRPATILDLVGSDVLLAHPRDWSFADTQAVTAAFATAGSLITVQRPWRFTPEARTTGTVLATNEFGPLVLARLVDIEGHGPIATPDRGIADLVWTAVASIDLTTLWLDAAPVGVYAQMPSGDGDTGAYLCVTVRHVGGATTVCETGVGSRPLREIFLQGTTGSMTLPWSQPPPSDTAPDIGAEIDAWLDARAGDRSSGDRPHPLLARHRLFDAVTASLATGDLVAVDAPIGAGR